MNSDLLPRADDGPSAREVLADLAPWLSLDRTLWKTPESQWADRLRTARYLDWKAREAAK